MSVIKIELSYDGTDFSGFQFQPDTRTVQGTLEQSISKLTQENVKICGCSRTDSGVHANNQVAIFETSASIPPNKFHLALKSYLPNDIEVYSSCEVDKDFHPSRDAIAKKYTYLFSTNDFLDIRQKRYWCHVRHKLNIEDMQEGCQLIVGKKDFKSFCAAGSQVKTTVRQVYACNIENLSKNNFKFTIIGDGFLYKMVRIIVGTLIEIGTGNISVNDLQEIIASKDRKKAPYTAPPHGLCLEKVWYNKEILQKNLTNMDV